MMFKTTDDGTPIIVERRCKVRRSDGRRCGKLLDEIVDTDRPITWAGMMQVTVCPKHHPEGAWGDVEAWRERQRRAGKYTGKLRQREWVDKAALRKYWERAKRRNETDVWWVYPATRA